MRCIICGSDEHRVFKPETISSDDITFEKLNQCKRCGLFWLSPRMSDKEYREYYSNDSYSKKRRPAGIDKESQIAAVNALRLYHGVYKYLKSGKMLDIGCGLGKFMDLISHKFDCTGVDPSPTFTHHNSIVGHFPEDVPAGQYDLVTMIHSIEHMTDPINALESVHQFLKDDGMLIVEYPDIDIRWKYWHPSLLWFLKAHPYEFGENTMRMLLNKCGFKVDRAILKPFKHKMIVQGTCGPSIVEITNRDHECNMIMICRKS